jgi:hypothetical protein
MTQAQAGQPPPPDAGEVVPTALVVEVDGVHVHAGGDWHEMKVGLVAPLGPATRTVKETGRVALTLGRQSACAGFETAALFWYRVYVAACQRGLGGPELALVVVLGDGAGWIWKYAWQFLVLAQETCSGNGGSADPYRERQRVGPGIRGSDSLTLAVRMQQGIPENLVWFCTSGPSWLNCMMFENV